MASSPPLPSSVEDLLAGICSEQSLPPPDPAARAKLSALGEEASLRLLKKISTRRIQGLSKLILFMANWPEEFASPVGTTAVGPTARQSVLEAMGELDFRRAFLILSYIGRNKLEDIMNVDTIKNLKCLSMVSFEQNLWNIVKDKDNSISESDRRQNFDWDSRKSHVYQCEVDNQGNFAFKGPYLQSTQTHLHRVLGDDNVLLVKFAEYARGSSYRNLEHCGPIYHRIANKGILVGLRLYRFFLFKDGGKEEKKKDPTSSSVKCYFVRISSTWSLDLTEPYTLSGKTIEEARSIFMHVHTVSTLAKYMARFSLVLSKTIKLDIDLSPVKIEEIEDIPCVNEHGVVVRNKAGEPKIHTDGTGFISEDLAMRCPNSVSKGSTPMNFQRFLEELEGGERTSSLRHIYSLFCKAPLLIQCRLFYNGCAVKGTLLVNKRLPPETIQVRPSMIKVRPDKNITSHQSINNSLEIVGTSNKPQQSHLSRFLIALLHYGGVPTDYFLDLQECAMQEADNYRHTKKAALRAAVRHGTMDNFLAARMILCGIPLEEPYLQSHLVKLMREDRRGLGDGRIPVTDCFYLMGTTDPTGRLEANEVCVILDNGQISGDVLVYKHPGLHFGDIHKLKAKYIEELHDYVGNSKYAIFFPTKGPRSLADEMANSDFDGDIYWVSKNPQLLQTFIPSAPWEEPNITETRIQPKPADFSSTDLENKLFQQFLDARFNPSYAMGAASDAWLVYMDRLLTAELKDGEEWRLKEKMLRLVNIYYDALDASKSGSKVSVPDELRPELYPHFMGRSCSYKSTSILGKIYDKVNDVQLDDLPVSEIEKLACFDSEKPPYSCKQKWDKAYVDYKKEMAMALKPDANKTAPDEVIQKYKIMLYGAEEFEEATRSNIDIRNEALAIYHICYNFADENQDVGKCGFAWKVAGHVLCKIYLEKQKQFVGPTFYCSKAVLQEVLGK